MRTYCRRTPGLLVVGMVAGLFLIVQPAVSQDVTGVPKDTMAIENPSDQMTEDALEAVEKEVMTITPDPVDDAATTVDEVRERLSEQLPGILFTDIVESTVSGLFEVTTGGQIYYVDETAQYLVDGSLIRLSDRANLTDARLGKIHMDLIQNMDEEDMLVYKADDSDREDHVERSITVFTDISCGFCRRLHAEIDTLLDQGVSVRYLLFPRGGLGSQGHKDLESVWCADNPQEAMTTAKAGGQIEPKSCDNPIEAHVALAESIGLRGTPLIYTDGGEKVPGYREASTLVTMVNGSEPMDAVAESGQ